MSRSNPFVTAGILLVFVLAYGGLPWLAGGLYLDNHEGDSYHFLDILVRMEAGQVPHLDFVTPLGVLTFLPIVKFIEAGFSAGAATILSQAAVALFLLPLVVYAGATRLSQGLALMFGLFTLGLTLALSYGSVGSGVTVSMHYNRWGWSITFVILALALLPPLSKPRPGLDGTIIGVLSGLLLLLKVTYFVTIVPVAALALATRWGVKGLGFALLGGLVVVAVATWAFGFGFWLAYLDDLRIVAASDVRPYVGVPLNEIVAGPAYVGATLVGLATIYLVRKSGHEAISTAIVLLVPAFLYISYQNFGNDPQWLLFVPVLLLALRPADGFGDVFGVDLRRAMSTTAIAAMALFFPSFFNIAMSPIEHLAFDKSRFLPMLPERAGHQDVFIRTDRAYMMTAQVFKDQEPGPWAKYEEIVERPPEPEFQGITFPNCEWMAGSRAFFEELTADLDRAGLPPGARLFTTDILVGFWFFGDYAAPEGSAPWYYGNLSGLENTDYVLIPKCGFVNRVRGIMIEDLAASDYAFELERDNTLYALFKVSR